MRAASVMTIYTFVFFLLAEGSLGMTCTTLSVKCQILSAEAVVAECSGENSGCQKAAESSPHSHVFMQSNQPSIASMNAVCCFLGSSEHERSVYLFEQQMSLQDYKLSSECIDFDSEISQPQFESFEPPDKQHCVHCSIPVTVLLR
jgi:hypothetical protein